MFMIVLGNINVRIWVVNGSLILTLTMEHG